MPNPPAKSAGLNAKTGGIKHKYWLIGGGGLVVVAYMHYRSQSAAAATTDPTATDPNAPDPNASDPYAGYDTGYGTGAGGTYGTSYADPSMQQAQQAQLDQQAADTQAVEDNATALGDLAAAFSAPVETNQDWYHQALKALENHGYTAAQAKHALTAYLAGAPLTTKQANTIESAVAQVGPPPSQPPPIVIHNTNNGNAGTSKSKHGNSSSGAKSSKTSNKHAHAGAPAPHKPVSPPKKALGWAHIPVPKKRK